MEYVPNLKLLEKQLLNIDKEFDLQVRIKRYLTMVQELIQFAQALGLNNPEDAARALFVSDYIITSSEVPPGTSDEKRNASVIKSFIKGLATRSPSSDSLMRIYYLAYKTAILIRRNDIIQADRGINRMSALLRLKDSFLTPYLFLAQKYLGKAPSDWELGILYAALKKTLPHQEIEALKDVPQSIEVPTLLHYTWKLMEMYALQKESSTNPNVTISNVNTTNTILIPDSSMPSIISVWNLNKNLREIAWTEPMVSLVNLLNVVDNENKSLIYLRARFKNTQLLLIREPTIPSKPLILLNTPADETNVSQVQSLLRLRGQEGRIWTTLEFTNLSDQQQVTETRKLVAVARKRKLVGIARPFRTSDDPRTELPTVYLPSFISEALTLDAVGDVPLFEKFDTVRESEYTLMGIIENNLNTGHISFLNQPGFDEAKSIKQSMDQIVSAINKVVFQIFDVDGESKFKPEELVYLLENNLKLLICITGNEDYILASIAITYVKETNQFGKLGKQMELDTFKRRMLHMRIGQLLNARRFTNLEEAVNRIFGSIMQDSRTSASEVYVS